MVKYRVQCPLNRILDLRHGVWYSLIIVVLLRSLQNKSHRGQPGDLKKERKAGLSSEEQPLGGRFVSMAAVVLSEVALRFQQQ